MQLGSQVALSGRDSGGKKCYPTVKRRPGLGAGYVTLKKGTTLESLTETGTLPAEGAHPD